MHGSDSGRQAAWPSRIDGPLHAGAGRGARPGDPAPPGRSRLRVAAAQGGVPVSGPVPARSGRRGPVGLGIPTARRARRAAAELRSEGEGATPAGRLPVRVAAIRPHSRGYYGSASMNESTLAQLKILVERAVRPVRASTPRKRTM